MIALAEPEPPADRLLVAFSGGLDSHVLLHRLASDPRLRKRYALRAVHIDHGLQADSARWADHCAGVCESLAVPLDIVRVTVRPVLGESPEAAARKARYSALGTRVDDVATALVTAHQRNDQAETLLLALMRGSGPRGLAAMPVLARFAGGWLWRPMLHRSRAELHDYASRQQLRWIEDPSNANTEFDRNYLRHRVVPLLEQRWPAAGSVMARTADHCAETDQLLEHLAAADLRSAAVGEALSVVLLAALSPARQRNLVRFWLRQHGLPVPGQTILAQLLTRVAKAGDDRCPLLRWQGGEVRRYRGYLYAMVPLAPAPDADCALPWPGGTELQLPRGGRLRRVVCDGMGLPGELVGLCVRYRRGGERFHPWGRAHGQTLKKLLQESAMPPWDRWRVPLIYWQDRLVAVPGVGVQAALACRPGWLPQWQKTAESATL